MIHLTNEMDFFTESETGFTGNSSRDAANGMCQADTHLPSSARNWVTSHGTMHWWEKSSKPSTHSVQTDARSEQRRHSALHSTQRPDTSSIHYNQQTLHYSVSNHSVYSSSLAHRFHLRCKCQWN